MIKKGDKTIIGIDHGYGYVKTKKTIIKSGVSELPIRPPFTEDLIEYQDKVYCVGQNRTEHLADKTLNQDYYILTLAAIALEMQKAKITTLKNVIIAAGLPYSFLTQQQKSFRQYLSKNRNIDFKYEGKKYHVGIKDVKIFPQGFPVIAKLLEKENKTISVVDIGSRTIDILTFRNGKPLYDMCFSIDKRGTIDCMEVIKKYYLSQFQMGIDEEDIQRLFQNLPVSLPEENKKFVKEYIRVYINDVMRQLNGKGIVKDIVFCGGGATVIKNFYNAPNENIEIVDDIHCNASGYEMLADNIIK